MMVGGAMGMVGEGVRSSALEPSMPIAAPMVAPMEGRTDMGKKYYITEAEQDDEPRAVLTLRESFTGEEGGPEVTAYDRRVGFWTVDTRGDIKAGDLGADLTGADLTNAVLTGADLTGADLTDADLTGADLTGADLAGAVLTDAVLRRAALTGAVLTDADLTGADLTDADLTGADLTGAVLTDADLTDAVLTDADLTDAVLCRCNGVVCRETRTIVDAASK